MRQLAGAALFCAISVHSAAAEAPRTSVVPVARPAGFAAAPPPEVVPVFFGAKYRPKRRPLGFVVPQVKVPERAPLVQAATRAKALCGDRAILGQPMSSIAGKLIGCGVADPVKVYAVSGVRLSQPAILDCVTAKSLKNWVEKGAKPAIGRTGGGLASLRIAAHYSCRSVNNRQGARISEHGKGRAIDISALTLKNGHTITVLKDYGRGRFRKALRRMYKAACGPFTTTLGPGSDRYHQDHFHFDTSRRASGRYCR